MLMILEKNIFKIAVYQENNQEIFIGIYFINLYAGNMKIFIIIIIGRILAGLGLKRLD